MLLILDAQPLMASALARIARLAKRGIQIEVTSDPRVFRQKLPEATAAVIDIDTVGLTFLKQIPCLAIGTGPDHTIGASAVRAGARGYLNRNTTTEDDTRLAILKLLSGRSALTEGVGDGLLQIKESTKFSGRELEVAQGLLAGLNGNEIAERAGVSRATIQTYETRLHSKLNTSNRKELVEQLQTIFHEEYVNN